MKIDRSTVLLDYACACSCSRWSKLHSMLLLGSILKLRAWDFRVDHEVSRYMCASRNLLHLGIGGIGLHECRQNISLKELPPESNQTGAYGRNGSAYA